MIGLLVAVTGVVAAVVPGRIAFFVVGFGVASAFWYVALLVVQVAGTTRYLLGSLGEEWTSDVLRRLRRRGWHVIEQVPLEHGDIDHVLLGPGGVFAIETKASSGRWDLDVPDHRLTASISQCHDRARRLRALLQAGSRSIRAEPTPVLVLWGEAIGEARRIDGVEIVRGSELRAWIERLGNGVFDAEVIERTADGLWEFVDMRDDYIGSQQDGTRLLVEVGPFALLARLSEGVVGALGMMLLFGLAVPIASGYAIFGVLAGAALAGVGVLRFPRLRTSAVGWLAMVGGLTAALLAALLAAVLWNL